MFKKNKKTLSKQVYQRLRYISKYRAKLPDHSQLSCLRLYRDLSCFYDPDPLGLGNLIAWGSSHRAGWEEVAQSRLRVVLRAGQKTDHFFNAVVMIVLSV